MTNLKTSVEKTFLLKTDHKAYERALHQIKRFERLHPDECRSYDLSLMPFFYTNTRSIVPVIYEGKTYQVLWNKFCDYVQLSSQKTNQVRFVYVAQLLSVVKDHFWKCGTAKHFKKRFEQLDKSFYSVQNHRLFGPFEPDVAKKVEQAIQKHFEEIKFAPKVPLKMRGESECFAGFWTDHLAEIEKIINSLTDEKSQVGFDALYTTAMLKN
jgi:hypothetical protein